MFTLKTKQKYVEGFCVSAVKLWMFKENANLFFGYQSEETFS